jgi:hypothetical protein
VNISEVLDNLLHSVPQVDSTTAQLIMLENYETVYRIFDHTVEKVDHPFALVEMHPAEDNISESLLRERMRQFAFHDVNGAFGVSWLEFLELPTDHATEILLIASEKKAKDDKSASTLANELKNLNK